MNRKQRRASQSSLEELAKRHRRTLALRPDDAQAHNELACLLLQQGRRDEAADEFASAVTLLTELLEQYSSLVTSLLHVNPVLREGLARVASAWPRELSTDDVLGSGGFAATSRDPFLRCMLQ